MIRYWRDVDLPEIIEAREATVGGSAIKPESHYGDTQATLSNVRKAYRGGSLSRDLLLERKIGETNDQWDNRHRNFQNVPLTRIIVAFKSSLLYVKDPERHLYFVDDKEASMELDDAFGDIYEEANAPTLFSKQVAPRTNRDMASWVKVWYDENTGKVRLTSLLSENVLVVTDPDDVDTGLAVVEIRKDGNGFTRWLWTPSTFGKIDADWSWMPGKDGPKDNPIPGVIPYVCFGGYLSDMGNQLDDAVYDQKHLVNLRSHLAMGVRSQTYKQLWTAGKIKGPRVKSAEGDGNERVMLSPETVIQMDDGGSVNYASPDFPVSAVLEAERQELKRALETYRVSAFSVDPSSAPEQPMSLAIKMLPSMWDREESIKMFADAERTLGYTVAAYGANYDLLPISVDQALNREAIECCVEFESTILPSDAAVERQADAADVTSQYPMMLREDYIRKYHAEGADQNEIDAMMLELDAQAAARAAMTASMFGGITPARPAFNLAGATPGAGSNGQSNASALLARLDSASAKPKVDTEYGGMAGDSSGGGTASGYTVGAGSTPIGSGGGKTVPTLG